MGIARERSALEGATPDGSSGVATAGDTAKATRDQVSWDRLVLAGGGHLLQSWAWGELKRRHGWQVARVHVATAAGWGCAQVLFRHRGPVSVAYVPRGPVVRGDATSVFPALVAEVDAVCRRHRAVTLIVEPDAPLGLAGTYRGVGFVRCQTSIQPRRTVKVPLLDDEAIIAQMHQKNRYNIRLATRRGVVVDRVPATDDALSTFYGLLAETAGRNEFGIHAPAYYADFLRLLGEDAVLLFATVDGHVAAGAMAARFGGHAMYMYGASSTTTRADGAAFLLQYEAMRWARGRGAGSYDLWGIPEQDPGSPDPEAVGAPRSHGEDQRGLYNFKVRFGGEIVTFPVPMERRYLRLLAVAAHRLASLGG